MRRPQIKVKINVKLGTGERHFWQDNENNPNDDTAFLIGIQKDYNIPSEELKLLFKAVSHDHKDMLEYTYSGGQKNHILWNQEEDDTLLKNHGNSNHHLMKLLMRLKGPERIEKRLAYLGV